MPITELVFPLFKLDPESLAGLQEKQEVMFQAFSGVEGILEMFRGPILEENGDYVDPKSMRTVLAIEWTDASAFHAFFPHSNKFQQFLNVIKQFAAGPAVPELYEALGRSTSCFSSGITQIIKTSPDDGTEDAWKRLTASVEASGAEMPQFYHANGTEKDQGQFLGVIGWRSLEQYRQFGKGQDFLSCVEDLSKDASTQNIVVDVSKVDVL